MWVGSAAVTARCLAAGNNFAQARAWKGAAGGHWTERTSGAVSEGRGWSASGTLQRPTGRRSRAEPAGSPQIIFITFWKIT